MAHQTIGNRQPKESPFNNLDRAKRDLQDKAVETKDAVQEKAAEVKEAVTKSAEKVWENLQDVGADVKHRVVENIEEWRDTAAEYVEEGRNRVGELGAAVARKIRSQPFTSVLVAVGVGILFGAIWRRR